MYIRTYDTYSYSYNMYTVQNCCDAIAIEILVEIDRSC